MAGGQLSRAQQARLDQAFQADRATTQEISRMRAAAAAAARPGADERPAAIHCWVHGPPDDPGPFPGLITAWRRLPWGGWSARVTYAIPRNNADTLLTQQWLSDEHISPPRN